VPAAIAEPEWLSPWAVTTRYDDLDDTLDRHADESSPPHGSGTSDDRTDAPTPPGRHRRPELLALGAAVREPRARRGWLSFVTPQGPGRDALAAWRSAGQTPKPPLPGSSRAGQRHGLGQCCGPGQLGWSLVPWHGPLFGLKCPELPGEFGPPTAKAGPLAIKASTAAVAVIRVMRLRMMRSS